MMTCKETITQLSCKSQSHHLYMFIVLTNLINPGHDGKYGGIWDDSRLDAVCGQVGRHLMSLMGGYILKPPFMGEAIISGLQIPDRRGRTPPR